MRRTAALLYLLATVGLLLSAAPGRADAPLPARTKATTPARMHHAVTSSTAAQAIATEPTRVRRRPRSARIRASTGNAVTLIAAPMKSAKP